MAKLWQIRMLGGMEIRSLMGEGENRPIRIRRGRASALMALLSLSPGRAISRCEAIEALWPEVEEDVGRLRLRQELFTVRRLLEPPDVLPGSVLDAAPETLRLCPDAVETDVQRFEEMARSGDTAAAFALWRGELLPGFWDEWVLWKRHYLNTLYEALQESLPAGTEGLLSRDQWGEREQLTLTLLSLLPGGATITLLEETAEGYDIHTALAAFRETGWVTHRAERFTLAPWAGDLLKPRLRRREQATRRLLNWYGHLHSDLVAPLAPPDIENLLFLLSPLLESPERMQALSDKLRTSVAGALSQTVRGLYVMGRKAESRRLGEMALSYRSLFRHGSLIYLLTGVALTRLENDSEAKALFTEAFLLARDIGQESVACNQLFIIGVTAHHVERDAEAIRCFEEALRFCESTPIPRLHISILTEFATALSAQGRTQEARQRYEEAIDLIASYQGENSFPHAVCLLCYAGILCEMSDLQRAREKVDAALTLLIPENGHHEIALAERQLARIALQEGEYGLARLHALHSQSEYARHGNEGAVYALEEILGSVALGEGKIEEARSRFQRGLGFWRDRGHSRWQAAFTLLLARCAMKTGETVCARDWLEETLSLCAGTRALAIQREAQHLRDSLLLD